MSDERSTVKVKGVGVIVRTTEDYHLTLSISLDYIFFWQRRTPVEQIPSLLADYIRPYGLTLEDQGAGERSISPSEFNCIIRSSSYDQLRKLGQRFEARDNLPKDLLIHAWVNAAPQVIEDENRQRAYDDAYLQAQKKAERMAQLIEKKIVGVQSVSEVRRRYDGHSDSLYCGIAPLESEKSFVTVEATFYMDAA
ncbi:MAG: hypothetical protein P1V97_35190 [Planctomycetota bacterium]|nr:hypothetical protein [Planctomycetota bacterium]